MGKKYSQKVHQEPLREEWAQSLLAARDPNCGGSLFAYLQGKKDELADSIRRCREHLEKNPLTGVVAEAAAREIGRGGSCSITINEQGTVLLEVTPKKPGEKRTWQSRLPSIKELRAEAKEMGLDISGLGRSKRKIFDALQEAKKTKKPTKKARKKMVKTGDAITPPRVVDPSNLPFDESSELPADLLDGGDSQPDMQAAMTESDDLDLDAILDDPQD